MEIVHKLKQFILGPDQEQKIVIRFLEKYATTGASILDVGSGFGRNLRVLKRLGYDIVGIEKNPVTVEILQNEGLPCITPEAAKLQNTLVDVILISHVIEHFAPEELEKFLAEYLKRLKPNGHLIIATPLMSPYFYDDFDHVRPYHPDSLLLLMGEGQSSQMQYHGNVKIRLLDVWFRKSAWRLNYCRGRYIPGISRKIFSLTNLIGALLFRISFGTLGRTDGWVGIFLRKN